MEVLIDSLFTKKQMAVYDNLYISPYPCIDLTARVFTFFLFSFDGSEWFFAGYDATEACG